MSDELHGVDEIAPFTREDFDKCREIFKQHRLTRSELYGTWLDETAEEKALRELAKQYHERCEAYDQVVCTGKHPKTGEAIPASPYQLRSINANAIRVRADIIQQGHDMGFMYEQITRAIQNYGKGRDEMKDNYTAKDGLTEVDMEIEASRIVTWYCLQCPIQ